MFAVELLTKIHLTFRSAFQLSPLSNNGSIIYHFLVFLEFAYISTEIVLILNLNNTDRLLVSCDAFTWILSASIHDVNPSSPFKATQ